MSRNNACSHLPQDISFSYLYLFWRDFSRISKNQLLQLAFNLSHQCFAFKVAGDNHAVFNQRILRNESDGIELASRIVPALQVADVRPGQAIFFDGGEPGFLLRIERNTQHIETLFVKPVVGGHHIRVFLAAVGAPRSPSSISRKTMPKAIL